MSDVEFVCNSCMALLGNVLLCKTIFDKEFWLAHKYSVHYVGLLTVVKHISLNCCETSNENYFACLLYNFCICTRNQAPLKRFKQNIVATFNNVFSFCKALSQSKIEGLALVPIPPTTHPTAHKSKDISRCQTLISQSQTILGLLRWKTTSIFSKREDDLNIFKYGRRP